MMTPIFIGGASRSGTTMLGSLLQCIPNSCVTPESQFKWLVRWEDHPDFSSYSAALFRNWKFQKWDVHLESLQGPEPRSEAEALERIVCAYGNRKVEYWIDHTPQNLQYVRHYHRVFPSAKFVHIVRDGRAVANSVMKLSWGANTAISAASGWNEAVGIGCAAQVMFPGRVLLVRYEDVVRQPVAQIQRILDFVGVDKQLRSVEDLVLSDGFLPSYTRQQHASVGKLPDPAFIDKWKQQMTPAQIRDFECIARKMLLTFDYSPLTPYRTRMTKVHVVAEYVRDKMLRKLLNPVRFKQLTRQ